MTHNNWTRAEIAELFGLAFAATLSAPIPERPQFGVFRM